MAQSNYSFSQAIDALWRWLPFIVSKGFMLNLIVSFLTMLIGTIAGVLLGLGQISPLKPIMHFSKLVTQLFRNSPWLVLLFYCMFMLPFEITIGGLRIPFPDWIKAVIGLSLPVSGYVRSVEEARKIVLETGIPISEPNRRCMPIDSTGPRKRVDPSICD